MIKKKRILKARDHTCPRVSGERIPSAQEFQISSQKKKKKGR
jgi:hypothetical protein